MNQFEKEWQDEFVIEYFKQVREELTTRVQIHTNLVLQKVATCGAALGFLFNQKATPESLVAPEIQLLGFAIIPIIAMGYDVLIARNINALHRLGTFIRNELESLVTHSLKLRLWETKYGQPKTLLLEIMELLRSGFFHYLLWQRRLRQQLFIGINSQGTYSSP